MWSVAVRVDSNRDQPGGARYWSIRRLLVNGPRRDASKCTGQVPTRRRTTRDTHFVKTRCSWDLRMFPFCSAHAARSNPPNGVPNAKCRISERGLAVSAGQSLVRLCGVELQEHARAFRERDCGCVGCRRRDQPVMPGQAGPVPPSGSRRRPSTLRTGLDSTSRAWRSRQCLHLQLDIEEMAPRDPVSGRRGRPPERLASDRR